MEHGQTKRNVILQVAELGGRALLFGSLKSSVLALSWSKTSGLVVFKSLTKSNRVFGSPANETEIHEINFINGKYRISAHIEPNTLNNRCPIAARLAHILPDMEAMSGVIHVPMLLPSTIAAAISNEIQPLLHITSTRAKVALEDCIIMVITIPIKAKRSMEPKPICV